MVIGESSLQRGLMKFKTAACGSGHLQAIFQSLIAGGSPEAYTINELFSILDAGGVEGQVQIVPVAIERGLHTDAVRAF